MIISDGNDLNSGKLVTDALTPTQSVVAKVWADLLPIQDFGLDDDFIRLGGDSLIAKSVMMRVSRQFGVKLPMSALFRARTIRKLSDYVETAQKASPQACPPSSST